MCSAADVSHVTCNRIMCAAACWSSSAVQPFLTMCASTSLCQHAKSVDAVATLPCSSEFVTIFAVMTIYCRGGHASGAGCSFWLLLCVDRTFHADEAEVATALSAGSKILDDVGVSLMTYFFCADGPSPCRGCPWPAAWSMLLGAVAWRVSGSLHFTYLIGIQIAFQFARGLSFGLRDSLLCQ